MIESVTNPDAHLNLRGLSLDSQEKIKEPRFVPERDFTESDWEKSLAKLEEFRAGGDWRSFAGNASALYELNPQRALSAVTPDDWKGMENLLQEYERDRNWHMFSYQVGDLAVLDRNKTLSLVTKRDWEAMLDTLVEMHPSFPKVFDDLAGNLARLDLSKLNEVFIEEDWQEMVKRFEEEQDGSKLMRKACNLAAINRSRFFPLMTDDKWNKMREAYREVQRNNKGYALAHHAADFTFLSRAEMALDVPLVSDTPPLPEVRQF